MLASKLLFPVLILLATLAVDVAAQEKGQTQQCTASKTTDAMGTWKAVRHQLKEGKAKCFESKCDITWQEYKEATCPKKIIKRSCTERNVKIVDEKVPC